MIETFQSPDLVDLVRLHYQYIAIEDSEEAILFKPRSIIFDKEIGVWELTVELISNQKYDDNEQEIYGDSGFSRSSSGLHSLGQREISY